MPRIKLSKVFPKPDSLGRRRYFELIQEYKTYKMIPLSKLSEIRDYAERVKTKAAYSVAINIIAFSASLLGKDTYDIIRPLIQELVKKRKECRR